MEAAFSDYLDEIISILDQSKQENLLTDDLINDLLSPLFCQIDSLEDEKYSNTQELCKVKKELAFFKVQKQDASTDQPELPDREIKIYRIVKTHKKRPQKSKADADTETIEEAQEVIEKTRNEDVDFEVKGNDSSNTAVSEIEDESELVDTIIETNNQVSLTELYKLYNTGQDTAKDTLSGDIEDDSAAKTSTSRSIRDHEPNISSLTKKSTESFVPTEELLPYSQTPGLVSWRTINGSLDARLPQRKRHSSRSSHKATSEQGASSLPLRRTPLNSFGHYNRQHILKSNLKALLLLLKNKDEDEIFHWPVDTDYVKDYLLYVKYPMDFSTMEKKINGGEYQSLVDFVMDLNLIITNCESYNDPETIYYKAAQRLRKEAVPLIESTSEKIIEAAGKEVDEAIKCPCPVHDPHFRTHHAGKKRRCLLDSAKNKSSRRINPISPKAASTTSRPSSVASNSTSSSKNRKRRRSRRQESKKIGSDAEAFSDSSRASGKSHQVFVVLDSDSDEETKKKKQKISKGSEKEGETREKISGNDDQVAEEKTPEKEKGEAKEPIALIESDDASDEFVELINPFTGMIETSTRKANIDDLMPTQLVNPFTGMIEETTINTTVEELKLKAEQMFLFENIGQGIENPFQALFDLGQQETGDLKNPLPEPLSQTTIEATLAPLATNAQSQQTMQQTPIQSLSTPSSCMFDQSASRTARSQHRQSNQMSHPLIPDPISTPAHYQQPIESCSVQSSPVICNSMTGTYDNETSQLMYNSSPTNCYPSAPLAQNQDSFGNQGSYIDPPIPPAACLNAFTPQAYHVQFPNQTPELSIQVIPSTSREQRYPMPTVVMPSTFPTKNLDAASAVVCQCPIHDLNSSKKKGKNSCQYEIIELAPPEAAAQGSNNIAIETTPVIDYLQELDVDSFTGNSPVGLFFQGLQEERVELLNPLNCKCPKHNPTRKQTRGRPRKCIYD
jgi:hypothetical protein